MGLWRPWEGPLVRPPNPPRLGPNTCYSVPRGHRTLELGKFPPGREGEHKLRAAHVPTSLRMASLHAGAASAQGFPSFPWDGGALGIPKLQGWEASSACSDPNGEPGPEDVGHSPGPLQPSAVASIPTHKSWT